MGATQSAESRNLGREYAKRVTAQQYADMGDMNHATSFENKAAKYGYKADRTHARRFNRGKTPFPLAQHALPAMPGGAVAPTATMPMAPNFISAPTFAPTATSTFMQQEFAQPVQTPLMVQDGFMQSAQTFETPMLNYQAPWNEYSTNTTPGVETIVMPTTVLPPIIAPASANYW